MSFGERLQALRRSSGLTQEDFAGQLKVSRQSVSKWESGRGYPEIEKIIYICNRYRVSMSDLFRDEVPPAAEGSQVPPPAQDPLEAPTLKRSIGGFLANLSPANQLVLWLGAVLLLTVLLALFCVSLLRGGDNMVYKLVWSALLVLFVAAEAVSVGLTSIWFAAGSLAALICTLLGGPWPLQVGLFLAVSALCLLAFRPLAQKYINGKVEPTNTDRIIGTRATVTEEIDNIRGSGTVQVGSMPWTARSVDGQPIPAGTLVRILRIEGVKVYVELIPQQEQKEVVRS